MTLPVLSVAHLRARTINMGLNEIEFKILDIARSREGDSGFTVDTLYCIYAGKVKTISNFIEFYEDFILE